MHRCRTEPEPSSREASSASPSVSDGRSKNHQLDTSKGPESALRKARFMHSLNILAQPAKLFK